MKRIKSTSQDEINLVDSSLSSPDRVASMVKLAFDGYGDLIEPTLIEWLEADDFLLRYEAIEMLLGVWCQERYFPKALQMLHEDEEWIVRSSTAGTLVSFVKRFIRGEEYIDEVRKNLLLSLINDSNKIVQQTSYENSLDLIEKKKEFDDTLFFNRQTDVKWELLQPYLDKFGLKRPND